MSNTRVSSDSEDFNKFFKDKLEHWEEEPPANGWKSLETVLDKKQSGLSKWYTAAAILLLLLPAVFFIPSVRKSLSHQDSEIGQPIEVNEAIAKTPQVDTDLPSFSKGQQPECNMDGTNYSEKQIQPIDVLADCETIEKDLITTTRNRIAVNLDEKQVKGKPQFQAEENIPKNDINSEFRTLANAPTLYVPKENSNGSDNSEVLTKKDLSYNQTQAEKGMNTSSTDHSLISVHPDNNRSISMNEITDNTEQTALADSRDSNKLIRKRGNLTHSQADDHATLVISERNDLNYTDNAGSETTSRDSLIKSLPKHGNDTSKKDKQNKRPSALALHNKPRNEHPFDQVDSVDNKNEVPLKAKSVRVTHNKNKKASRNSKWHLQPGAGVFYTFKKVNPSKDMVYITGFENANELSSNNVGYQFNLNIRREVLKQTILTGGLTWQVINEYSNYNYYNIIADNVEVTQVYGDSFEVTAYSNIANNEVNNTLQYLGINLGVIQKIKLLRRNYNVMAGVSILKSAGQKYQNNTEQHRFDANSTIVSVRGGLEKTVSLTPYWSVTFTPYVEQTLNTVYTSESTYKLNPLKIGLDIGLLIPTGRK